MKKIRVNLKNRSYDIIIGSGVLKHAGSYISKLKLGNDAYIITTAIIKRLYGKLLEKTLKNSGFSVRFKVVPDGEKSKSIETLSEVINDLALYDKGRHIFIAAFGGGVVGDLAGFIASIYKRGISYVQIPTTLLAQVDSSIGGKTAVDLSHGKNLVGAFHQPRLVISDVSLLKTLSKRELASGLAEVIKYAIIKDPYLFRYLERNYKHILGASPRELELIIFRSSRIKAGIVSKDEKEALGLRTILNFGHTIGHAIESANKYKGYSHGEAIGLGILIATDLSARLGILKSGSAGGKIERLLCLAELPVKITDISLNKIIKAHYHDKKFIGKTNRMVLITGIGNAAVKRGIPLGMIEAAIKKYLARR